MWLGIVIQQLVPHTGNEVEEVRVGGARSGFTGVIPHQVIRTRREGEGNNLASDVLFQLVLSDSSGPVPPQPTLGPV